MARFFDSVNTALSAGLVGFGVWAWPRLPDRIPTHFGLNGMPDAWSGTTLTSWFLVPGLALLLAGGVGILRRILPLKPRWVNLPGRTKLVELPEAARGPVLEVLSGSLAMVQTEILVLFALVYLGTLRTAMGESSQGIMILVLLFAVLASPILTVVFVLGFQGAVERGRRMAAAQGMNPG